jgi:hypothetical protein
MVGIGIICTWAPFTFIESWSVTETSASHESVCDLSKFYAKVAEHEGIQSWPERTMPSCGVAECISLFLATNLWACGALPSDEKQ